MFKKLIIMATLIFISPGDSIAKVRGTTTIDGLYSTILSEQRDLLIQLPNSYKQNKKLNYPVLYLPDGLRNFNHASGTLDLLTQSHQAQEMIIVAIKNTQRTRDFTPSYDENYNQWGISGGADKFLDFIEQELKPYINKHYRTNGFNVLSGHSLGGLLTIYSLQTRPHLFQAHFAFSPSLWWHEAMIFKVAHSFYTNTHELNNYLYMNMADEGGNMQSSFERYKALLEKHSPKGFNYHTDSIIDENHSTSAMVGLNKAYSHLYKELECPNDLINKGWQAIDDYYKELSKTYGAELKANYYTLAQVAGASFSNKNYDQAIATYRKIISKFPHLSDPYYRIAYIYHAQSEYKSAVNAIDKALEMSIDENIENNKYKQFRAFILAEISKRD